MTQRLITADFSEAKESQLPFVELLVNMGYEYISADEALKQRSGDTSRFILKDIAREALMRINDYELNGEVKKFSDVDVDRAINDLESVEYHGVIDTSKDIYNMIMPTSGGKSIAVIENGKKTSKNFRYIDFENPENNDFHVTVEFDATGRSTIRPDIVVFVNGIPFSIIENKKSGVELKEAINQQLRNQNPEKCPKLFTYPQLLVAANTSSFKYGTTQTPAKFFVDWKEKDLSTVDKYVPKTEIEKRVKSFIQKQIPADVYAKILLDLNSAAGGHKQKTNRKVTPQDQSVVLMFEKGRLLDLCKNYVIFTGTGKIISRYQQYFAIHKMLERIEQKDKETGAREGGLVWHTQGSGKSLTMVLFVRALIEHPHIHNPRVVVVTDRKDLDKQISETFKNANLKKDVHRTSTGVDLVKQIKKKNLSVITALVQKFDAAAKRGMNFIDEDPNIFVLIDEAHRTQSGIANLEMNRIIPNACYIGFTGTPLMKKEKSSYAKFGGYIDKYTIDDALADQVILPLIYEGRYVDLVERGDQIDKKEKRITEGLSEEEKKKVHEVSTKAILRSNPDRIEEIAHDIEKHYIENFQGTGLKAQVVAPSKFAAITFQAYFDKRESIQTAVVMSDESGNIDVDDERKQEVNKYLETIKNKYTSLQSYEQGVVDDFKSNDDGVEMLIVVDKLLTGFDAPRNTVLYLAKDLKDHNLLQAIARVNRLYSNEQKPKTAGFIIDYSENAKNLRDAMELFGSFEEGDVENTLFDIDEKIAELEQNYAEVHGHFHGIDTSDTEALITRLQEKVDRDLFYEDLRAFLRSFDECLALKEFPSKFGDKLDLYRREMETLLRLRRSVTLRYADKVDLGEYRRSLVKILDKYVDANGIELLTAPIDLSDKELFSTAVDTLGSDNAKAEAIAAQTEKTISEKYKDADPALYKRFSERIRSIIDEMRSGRMEDVKALQMLKEVSAEALEKKTAGLPKPIEEDEGAAILYRNVTLFDEDDKKADIVLGLTDIVHKEAIVDWHKNPEVQRVMLNKLDDYLYDTVKKVWSVELSNEDIRFVAEKVVDLAKKNPQSFSV